MSEKRKDSKGRILRRGEGQRKDGRYQFRYTIPGGQERCVYALSLEELRSKEQLIQRDLMDGIDYSGGEVSVSDLVTRYMGTRRNFTNNTKRAYGSAVNHIRNSQLGQRKIRDVKQSEARAWFVSLHDEGLAQNTISVIHNVLRPAFEMAVDDDLLRKNPFKFTLSELIPDDAYQRTALNHAQRESLLQFLREQNSGYYNDVLILLGTGLRVSELYGLTLSDVDLENRCIHVRKQLSRTAEHPYFVSPPKTKSGIRTIPMTQAVHDAFKSVIRERRNPKIELSVDGYCGFLFLDKNGRPKVAMHLENHMRRIRKKYFNQTGQLMPAVTPHVLRHTFCTNAQQAGMDVKTLQYIMGHSNVSVTLDVYTHTDYTAVQRVFERVAASL